jgi:hypothetical protein
MSARKKQSTLAPHSMDALPMSAKPKPGTVTVPQGSDSTAWDAHKAGTKAGAAGTDSASAGHDRKSNASTHGNNAARGEAAVSSSQQPQIDANVHAAASEQTSSNNSSQNQSLAGDHDHGMGGVKASIAPSNTSGKHEHIKPPHLHRHPHGNQAQDDDHEEQSSSSSSEEEDDANDDPTSHKHSEEMKRRKEERRQRRDERNRIRAEKAQALERVNDALRLSEELMNTDFEAEKWYKMESMLQTSQLTDNRLKEGGAEREQELTGIGQWFRQHQDKAKTLEKTLQPAVDLHEYSLDNVNAIMGRMTNLRASLESTAVKMVQNAASASAQDDTKRMLQEQQERFVQQVSVCLCMYASMCVYVCMHPCMCMYVCVCVARSSSGRFCVCVCMYASMFMYVSVYLCMCMCMCTCCTSSKRGSSSS